MAHFGAFCAILQTALIYNCTDCSALFWRFPH